MDHDADKVRQITTPTTAPSARGKSIQPEERTRHTITQEELQQFWKKTHALDSEEGAKHWTHTCALYTTCQLLLCGYN